MRTWRRIVMPIAATAAVALALTGCSGGNFGGGGGGATDENAPIKIGAVLDITGVGANLGVPEQNTLNMLAEQLNAEGGIDGRQVELTILDNTSTEDGAAKATNQLIENGVDLIIGASRTGPSLAMRPIAEGAKIPMISVAANASIIDGSDWVFKTAQNDTAVLEKILNEMQAEGITSVSLMRDATGFGEGVGEIITELGASRGITLTTTEKFEPSATDFTAQLTNIRSDPSQAVIIWGITPSAGLVQAQYDSLGITKPVYQSHGVANTAFFDTAGADVANVKAAMGRIMVVDQLPDSDPQKPVIDKFVQDYTAKFGESPSSFAGHAFDAWQLAVAGITKAGTADKEALRAALATASFTGVSGIFAFSPENHSGLDASALVIVQARDGRWNYLSGE